MIIEVMSGKDHASSYTEGGLESGRGAPPQGAHLWFFRFAPGGQSANPDNLSGKNQTRKGE